MIVVVSAVLYFVLVLLRLYVGGLVFIVTNVMGGRFRISICGLLMRLTFGLDILDAIHKDGIVSNRHVD